MNETIKLGRYLNKMMVSILLCSSILYGGGYIDEDVANWSKTSKKIYTHTYYFNHKKFVLEKYYWPINAKEEDFKELFYTLKIYKRGAKKPYYAYRADEIELQSTPYKFPYVVFHFVSLGASGAYNSLYMYDVRKKLKQVQSIGDTTLDLTLYNNKNTNNRKARSNYSNYVSNPILIGKDGKYYLEIYAEADNNATCNSQVRWNKVIYKLDKEKFRKYRTIFYKDKNTTMWNMIF